MKLVIRTGQPARLPRVLLALFLTSGFTAVVNAQSFQFQSLPGDSVATLTPQAGATAPPVKTGAYAAIPAPGAGITETAPVADPSGSLNSVASNPGESGSSLQPAAQQYALRLSTWREFEQRVSACWLEGQVPAVTGQGRFATFQIPCRAGAASMLVDRQSNTVTCSLPNPRDCKACLACAELLDVFDANVPGGQVCLVPMQRLEQSTAHELFAAIALPRAHPTVNARPASFSRRQDPAQPDQLPGEPNRQDQPGAGNPSVQEMVPAGNLLQAQPGQQDLIASLSGDQAQTVIGNVTVEVVPELNLIIVKGENPEDVARVKAMIQELVAISQQNQPKLERVPLQNSEPTVLAEQATAIYEAVYQANQGPASITPIPDPKGLLVAGSAESIATIKQIIAEYDVARPVEPQTPNFKKYELRYITASDAKQRIDEYFGQAATTGQAEPPEAAPVVTISDYRSNVLIVKASQVYLDQVDQLIESLDVVNTEKTMVARVFRLKNSLASNVQAVLQGAINGQQPNAGQGTNTNPQSFTLNQQNQNFNQGGQTSGGQSQIGSAALQLVTVDANGETIRSGILFDVRINADSTSNSLVVTAPQESMDLIAALIDQLDRIPEAETQIKVFQIVNGDAETIFTMLQTLFQSQGQQGQLGGQFGGFGGTQSTTLPLQTASAGPGATITGLNFSVDQRTNTIIASGPVGDLQVIEDLLIRLDTDDSTGRQVVVYRISNLFAEDMATSVNEWLDNRRSLITQVDPTSINGYTASRREVIVVPEVVSNSLIINARPEYLDEVMQVIQALDRRPPMVKVKVLIAEVNLSMLEEFGADIGVQDSMLFDRGLGVIGYPFNQAGIGNNNNAAALASREDVAGQALSNLGTGRINQDLGYGGLVLSAGNESINVLLRALKDKQCARVLSAPQLTTVEGQPGRTQVGSTVRFISGSTVTNGGVVQNNVEAVDIGVILEITPRVTPDGMIVMRVNAINSTLGDEAQGTTVAVSANGDPIRVPPILATTAQTVIMARHGQTVVFSGLIREEKNRTERGAPWISDIPLLGNLFKFQGEEARRSELLIVLTPYLVDGDEDIEMLNNEDMDRMHWCINDVAEVYGTTNYDRGVQNFSAPAVYYPDADPNGLAPATTGRNDGATAPPFTGQFQNPNGPAGAPASQPQYENEMEPAGQPAAQGRGFFQASDPAPTREPAPQTGPRRFQLPRLGAGNQPGPPGEFGFSGNPHVNGNADGAARQ